MRRDERIDKIDELVSSKHDLLSHLRDQSVSTQAQLSESLGVTVATISRNLSDLEEHGLVDRSDGQYSLTTFGERVLKRNIQYRADLAEVCTFETVRSIFDEAIDYHAPILSDCEVVFSDQKAPDAGLNAIRTEVQEAITVRAVFDSLLTSYFSVYFHSSTAPKTEITYVVPEDLSDSLRLNYRDMIEEVSETQPIELLLTPNPVEYSITVTEQRTGEKQTWIIAHSGSGVEALVRNDAPEAVEWAESKIEEYIGTASELDI
ncbi:transcriptional regulator FilR1 domain-containing protein [Halobellus sp. GM3]|uniref:transcriptional regulator FilR1 domain-containing protein n=1 Tax=Halobellus sp. GM3 TaxID=3458410 RepID=UPI00403DAC99